MNQGFLADIVRTFIDSKITPLLLLSMLLLGAFAILVTPREVDTPVEVPMMDIFVELPGAVSKEVEERVTFPLEKLLAEIPGVDTIASVSRSQLSMITVVFYLGEEQSASLTKLYSKLATAMRYLPPEASPPQVQPRSTDDVPVLTLTFWSQRYDQAMLRRLVAQLDDQVRAVPEVAETTLIGGPRRQVKIILDTAKLAAFHLDPNRVLATLQSANVELPAGSFARGNAEYQVTVGSALRSVDEVRRLVIDSRDGRPVYLSDIAVVEDGLQEPTDYVFFTPGPAAAHRGITAPVEPYPALTLAVAQRRGANAVVVVEEVLAKVDALKGTLIPADVQVTVTRNYGADAEHKVNELIEHLLIAIVSVSLLITLFLGWRAAVVVCIAIPTTLALTLFFYYATGYTLNRITLVALIFTIGILVDDPIVDVENIVRHYRLPQNRGRSSLEVTIEAVNEVRGPLILATLAVILAILPMATLPGMMGAFGRPIPVGATAAMIFSMLIAFVLTPWAAYRLLQNERGSESLTDIPSPSMGEGKGEGELLGTTPPLSSSLPQGERGEKEDGEEEGWTTKVYRRLMIPLIHDSRKRWLFLGGVGLLLAGSLSLLFTKVIPIKFFTYDNKAELNVIIDMPEGTPLEGTAQAAQAIGRVLGQIPEVTDYQSYIGTAAPYNFTGFVRRYFLRQGPNVADIAVALLPKGERTAHSHDIAKRIRRGIQPIVQQFDARVTIAEIPGGIPVQQTLVAEVYGPDYGKQIKLAREVQAVFEQTPGVVDVDWSVEAPQPISHFQVDQAKAALHGIATSQVVQTLQIALGGMEVGRLRFPQDKEPIPLVVRLPQEQRSSLTDLQALRLASAKGQMVPLAELIQMQDATLPLSISHKNLKPVVYVTGDVAGEEESPPYGMFTLDHALAQLMTPEGKPIPRYLLKQPFLTEQFAIKWDGEWHGTTEFLVGAGPVFIAVLILIYLLVVAWFQSFTIPLVILVPIPLSLIGILPAYALTGIFLAGPSALGFTAGAGIVVRNSIILVDFIELRRQQGMPLAEAVVEAGAIRFRPMLLTALAVVVGSAVLLLDPIFQGMALSLIGGEVAATALSRVVVPVLYYMSERRHEAVLLKSSVTLPPSTSVPNTGVLSLRTAATHSPSSGNRFAKHE